MTNELRYDPGEVEQYEFCLGIEPDGPEVLKADAMLRRIEKWLLKHGTGEQLEAYLLALDKRAHVERLLKEIYQQGNNE